VVSFLSFGLMRPRPALFLFRPRCPVSLAQKLSLEPGTGKIDPRITWYANLKTVQLFVTCLIDSFFPDVGESIGCTFLPHRACGSNSPSAQTCCRGNRLFFSNGGGLRSRPAPWPEHTIRVFEKTAGDIIIPSGSLRPCCATATWSSQGGSALVESRPDPGRPGA